MKLSRWRLSLEPSGAPKPRGPRLVLVAVALGLLAVAFAVGLSNSPTAPWASISGEQSTVAPTATQLALAPTPTMTGTPVPTSTATPTNTPSPPSPTPTPRPPVTKVSKMGIGVYVLHAGDDVIDALYSAQVSIILMQDPDIGFARQVRALFPKAFIIGRIFFAQQPLDNPEQRGVAAADKVAEMAVPFKGLIDAWVSYNEPVSHNDYASYEAYNKFQVAFAKRLQDHYGIPAVAGNDAPGAIEPQDYAKYFGEAIRTSRYFGIHAYAGPDANTFNTPDAIYYALRYRLIHDELEKAGIKNVEMVITEAGLGHGWLGKTKISEEKMAEEFMWLADRLEEDSYMKGMAIYGIFRGGDWFDFNIKDTRIPDLLGQYQPRSTAKPK